MEQRLQRVNGRFFAVWHDDTGKRHRSSLGTDDPSLARTRLAEFARQQASCRMREGAATVGRLYQAYLEDRRSEGRPSVARIADAWKRLAIEFADILPSAITKELCRGYAEKRKAAGARDGTIHVELGYLRAALRRAKRDGLIAEEPYVPLPRKPPPRDASLTKEEARKLLEATGAHHLKLFVILALSTAGRSGALLDLTWNRVDFQRRRIVLNDPDKTVTLKGRATVPMNRMAYAALKEARAGALSPYVIEWAGRRVRSVKKGIAAAARRAGLACSPHVLRHTAAVWMAEAGVPMEEISQYCGHRDMNTTRRIYARYSPDYLQQAARALEL
jgi:integrase